MSFQGDVYSLLKYSELPQIHSARRE